jgi:solute:Na+ symporter, SSS family
LFLAALFGAAMANLSSDFNSLAAIFVEDYYRPFKPTSSDRQRLRVAKIVVAFAGVLCIIVATALARSHGSALSLWYTVSAIVAGGLVGLFLLAFLAPRVSGTAANIGIVASLVFTAWATLTLGGGKIWNLGRFNFPLHDYMIGVIGHVILFAVGYAASFMVPDRSGQTRELTMWGRSHVLK